MKADTVLRQPISEFNYKERLKFACFLKVIKNSQLLESHGIRLKKVDSKKLDGLDSSPNRNAGFRVKKQLSHFFGIVLVVKTNRASLHESSHGGS